LVTLEYVMQLADRKNIFETRLLPLRENQILSIIRNITKQKEAQQALEESKARYRKVLEASPDPIIVYDMQGRATYINPAFTKTFGWAIDDIYMQKLDYIPEACKADAKKLRDMAASGKGFSGVETRRITKLGKVIDVSISSAVWRDSFGEPAGCVVTLRDITEKKELEARLIQAHKMEAIGLLAGGVAHDFNNLLTGVSGTVSLMMSELNDVDPFYNQLSNIERYIASAAELTGQLLGFAQGGKYEIKPTNVNTLIEQSAAMFGRTKKQIRIDLNLADDILSVEVDQVQIEQVLVNLYVNAWQAMPEGGVLAIQTENVKLDEKIVRIKKLPQNRMIKITVSDTGEGINETDLQYIFDPFYTTKQVGKGNGLGLASTYGIIKNHGGSIDVTSRKDHGTTFSIYLPASDKSVEEEIEIPDRIVSGTETILLIDDEAMVREVGQEMLKELGYHVKVAASGEEGVRVYETFQRIIDLVILDLIMPGTSGGETFDRLRQLNPQAKVLLASGYSVDGQAAAILERGCNGFMQKPFNMKQLSRKIRKALHT
jgi:PAS domain S-box-containing protein